MLKESEPQWLTLALSGQVQEVRSHWSGSGAATPEACFRHLGILSKCGKPMGSRRMDWDFGGLLGR